MSVNKKDDVILAIRIFAGDVRLYRRERAEALSEIKDEVDRQIEWLRAHPHGVLEPSSTS